MLRRPALLALFYLRFLRPATHSVRISLRRSHSASPFCRATSFWVQRALLFVLAVAFCYRYHFVPACLRHALVITPLTPRRRAGVRRGSPLRWLAVGRALWLDARRYLALRVLGLRVLLPRAVLTHLRDSVRHCTGLAAYAHSLVPAHRLLPHTRTT